MEFSDYQDIVLKRLPEVDPAALIELMNDVDVRRHMPLAKSHFGRLECERFVAAKEQIWKEQGYGPWAFVLGQDFLGWGGLQPEGDDVDMGLVLRRAHWGAGRTLCDRILRYAFQELDLDSVITLLPLSRSRVAGLSRLGFREDGRVKIDGETFRRFRLRRQHAGRRHLVPSGPV